MATTVGINGFGRIGRIILRACLQNSDICVTALNDPAIDAEYICYLIKFDSTHGKFKGDVLQHGDDIKINDYVLKLFHEKQPSNIPWQVAGVQYVVEASGMFTTLEKASGHLVSEGVKRVLVMAPSVDVPMIILGVNEDKLKPEQKVMSCASSTLYCLAPIMKVLEDHFGVAEGFITSIHAMTPSLKPLDGLCLRGKNWRDHRSIHQNIIPANTGACKALSKIIPQVKDKLTGLAFRVPIVDVSVLDITVRLNINTSLEEIMKNVEKASKFRMRNIIKTSCEEAVSSDFIGDSYSCILDFNSSLQLKPNFFKLICWYENEYSYACRVINSIMFSENQLYKYQLPSEITNVRPKIARKQNAQLQTEYSSRDCSSEVNPKVLCSVSQDAGVKPKPSKSSVVPRKTFISTHLGTVKPLNARKAKTRNEIFKIWNDSSPDTKCQTVVPNHKQNRSALFQSCLYIAQNVHKIECIKAHEKLGNAKKEFSKMVNITEDLLKKSCSNKIPLNSNFSINKEDIKTNLVKREKDMGVTNDEQNKINPHTCYNNKIYKDNSSNFIMTVDNCRRESISSNHFYDVNNSNYSYISINTNDKIKKSLKESNTSLTEHKSDTNAASDHELETETEKTVLQKILAQTVNTVVDGLSQNMHVQCADTNIKGFPRKFYHKRGYHNHSIHAKNHSISINPECELNSSSISATNQSISNVTEFQCSDKLAKDPIINKNKLISAFLNKESNNIRLIDKELKKRNIILLESNKDCINIAQDMNAINSDFDELDVKDSKELSKKILSTSSPEPVEILREESECLKLDTTTTLTNGNGYRLNQDIYDKLDSTSATDSSNSIEIKERKSQVLQISELTNSIEDLVRLDKICRIIEISDELSDQLFSALDNGINKLDTETWSFKDLCDRIKLDEFCSKVFEKHVG